MPFLEGFLPKRNVYKAGGSMPVSLTKDRVWGLFGLSSEKYHRMQSGTPSVRDPAAGQQVELLEIP